MANTLKFGNGEWYGKKDTIIAYNDENSNYKPLPFDFSRASKATVINKDGLIEEVGSGQPRIDYKDNTKGALLLEPTRSNIITYSENLNGAGWNVYSSTGGTCTRTLNYGISPSGKQDSTRVVFSTGTTALYFSSNITGNASATMYVKGISGEVIGFGWGESVASGTDFTFNGEWQRLEYNGTSANSTLSINDWGETRNARDFEIYGVQMEQGSYATSYIPTSGSAVTRLADACNNENLNVDYSVDYTLYLEHETLSITEYNQLQFRQETSISYILRVGNSINIGTNLYTTANTIGFNKFALSVTSSGSYNFYKNGVLLSSGSGLNANLETIRTATLGMSIKDLKLYNTALTDQELIALTQ
jgi:hypothetical protein